ncbi:MAG: hypothetical protein U0610_16830 [bacterium]
MGADDARNPALDDASAKRLARSADRKSRSSFGEVPMFAGLIVA